MSIIISKYPFCKNPNEYSGFGYCFNPRDLKWYKDVATFNDDFSTDTSGDYTASNATIAVDDTGLKITNTTTSNGTSTKSITTVVGKPYKVIQDTASGSADILISYNGVTVSDGDIVVADTTSTDLVATVDSTTSGHYGHVKYFSIIPLNDNETIDFSLFTAESNGIGIVGEAYIDASGEPERVSDLERETYVEKFGAKTIKCNNVNISDLLEVDPLIQGEIWNDNGTIKISSGA